MALFTRKQLANSVTTGLAPEISGPVHLRDPGKRCLSKRELYAGDVDDDHVAVKVVVLVLSGQVGGEERSVELICHDDFVV